MVASLKELIAKLFGAQQPQPIRVRIEDAPNDNLFKGRK